MWEKNIYKKKERGREMGGDMRKGSIMAYMWYAPGQLGHQTHLLYSVETKTFVALQCLDCYVLTPIKGTICGYYLMGFAL